MVLKQPAAGCAALRQERLALPVDVCVPRHPLELPPGLRHRPAGREGRARSPRGGGVLHRRFPEAVHPHGFPVDVFADALALGAGAAVGRTARDLGVVGEGLM